MPRGGSPRGGGRDRGERGERGGKAWARRGKRKVCQFCSSKAEWVDYKDTQTLRKYISDRGKIRARRVTGACSQHQRDVAAAVKNAREMGLLPYAVR